jgi:lipoprotein-anchoring transpeptidase ErfK/SrfK
MITVGGQRRPDRRSTSIGSKIPLNLGVVAALVAGLFNAQVFLPAPQGRFTDQPARIAAAAAAVTQPVAAVAVPRSPAMQSEKRSAPQPDAQSEKRSATTNTTTTNTAKSDTDLPRNSGTGRRVVYSVSLQRVWAVGELGRVQRTYLVSGRLSQPGAGHFRVYSRSRWTVSSVSAETMQYMVRFAHGARTGAPIGFHSIPRDYRGHPAQSVAELGKPLSAGCIRQRLRDAEFLWDFAHVGTTVVVTQ